ncbi:PREDICTED: uncharacterized protein LOC100634633 isoform X2 [Amphimedon queenslandica]|uniref:MATH domain-containing protein n=1 Tax=Amphimedon queenslandica TaxID=400682 RepID=A0A1X7VQ40_AMPQE|nr:PREDICTED: uncharacterized protein LOC100634633 isoform X2 [Amphimedon queenslandica]|eukprot:XP_019859236.1 PREDICTED: uncharacterized protein LOC100634633 isoform X2 [Amphimedon queenslandica]
MASDITRQISYEDEDEEDYVSMNSFIEKADKEQINHVTSPPALPPFNREVQMVSMARCITPPPLPPIPASRRPTQEHSHADRATRSLTPSSPNPKPKPRSRSTIDLIKDKISIREAKGYNPVYESIHDMPFILNHHSKSHSLDESASQKGAETSQNHAQDFERLQKELFLSQKREEEVLKRIDRQDEKIDFLEKSLNELRNDFQRMLLRFNQGERSSPTATLIGPTLKHPPCDFYMSNFSHHQHLAGSEWYSDPFYTGTQQGYKMCLQIVANGMGASAGKDVSICIKLMKGEYDDSLSFPFYGDITVQIINYLGDFNHAKRVISFNKSAAQYGASNRVHQETSESSAMAEKGWGIAAFLPHSYLPYNNQKQTEFVKNDTLTVRIASIALTSAN